MLHVHWYKSKASGLFLYKASFRVSVMSICSYSCRSPAVDIGAWCSVEIQCQWRTLVQRIRDFMMWYLKNPKGTWFTQKKQTNPWDFPVSIKFSTIFKSHVDLTLSKDFLPSWLDQSRFARSLGSAASIPPLAQQTSSPYNFESKGEWGEASCGMDTLE